MGDASWGRASALETDYLVVGAGFAGATLGFLLRQVGARVLCVELRDAATKDKLCAGLMMSTTLREIADLFDGDLPALVGASEALPWRNRCLGRESEGGRGTLSVGRKRLDDLCLARFAEAGGVVRDRVRLVSVDEGAREARCLDLRSGDPFIVRYGELVGADGALSCVRRLLTGRHGRVMVSFQGTVPARPEREIVMGLSPGAGGYCWYAPAAERATVGCYFPKLGAAEGRKLLGDFCGELGIALPALRGAPIPFGDDPLLRAGEHAWLVGDAAGLADAITGGGIHLALSSVRFLAASFGGGTPYEEAMAPTLRQLGASARNFDALYRRTVFGILRGSVGRSSGQ